MYCPDDAPPLTYFDAPYGGLGLKARSFDVARGRIDRLLAVSVDVALETVALTVTEPCTRAMIESVTGPLGFEGYLRGVQGCLQPRFFVE